jgi:hypothetical protein
MTITEPSRQLDVQPTPPAQFLEDQVAEYYAKMDARDWADESEGWFEGGTQDGVALRDHSFLDVAIRVGRFDAFEPYAEHPLDSPDCAAMQLAMVLFDAFDEWCAQRH